jgi:MYXO-CTERM domain-containing protein
VAAYSGDSAYPAVKSVCSDEPVVITTPPPGGVLGTSTTPTPSPPGGVLGISTTTPGTGAGVPFETGGLLILGGLGLIAAGRVKRRALY